MAITPEIRTQVQNHAFMQKGGVDFMRLWEIKDVSKIYEIVLLNVAAKHGVHWRRLYNEIEFLPSLCVSVLIIYDALKYNFFEEKMRNSMLQDRENSIVKSYFGIKELNNKFA